MTSSNMKIFISKNDYKKEDKHPDIHISYIATSGEFKKIGAAWKAKSGKGYSGVIEDEKLKQAIKEDMPVDNTTSPGHNGETINTEDIPF